MARTSEANSMQKAIAEGVGTLALIYVGMMTISVTLGTNLVAIALAHGLTIAVMASATMTISGGQLNPAVTIGLVAARKVTPTQGAINIAAQMVGGLIGGYLAVASLKGTAPVMGTPDLGTSVPIGTGILVEAVLTFFLMFVIMGTGVDSRFGGRIGGLAIGLTVTLDILAGGPITGAAMNPARWFGAAVAMSHYANWYVYFIGPIVGAVIAALLYQYSFLEDEKPAAA